MPNDTKHMEFASSNVYKGSSTAFTTGIKTTNYPRNKDTEEATKHTGVTAQKCAGLGSLAYQNSHLFSALLPVELCSSEEKVKQVFESLLLNNPCL